MVSFAEFDKIIKINEKLDKIDTYNGSKDIFFFIHIITSD